MKKGLTMLVAAMVVFGLICMIVSVAAEVAAEAAIGTGATAMIVFGLAMAIVAALALFVAMRAKKGHTSSVAYRSVKALNAVVLAVTTAVNAVYTRIITMRGIITSPRFMSKRTGFRTTE